MSKFNAGQSFADGDTVTGAKLNNIAGLLDIYTGLISEQTAMAATVSTADQLLIADTDSGDSGAANRVTVQKLLNDTLTNGTFTGLNLTGNLNVTQLSTLGTLNNTRGTVGILNSTTGTIQSLTSSTANISQGSAIFTQGTIGTLNVTTGTIATLNSTTGTITTGVIPTLTSTTLITTGTGTAASPAIVPTGDTNTGIFFPAADTIAFSEGGAEAMRIDSSGRIGIGTASPLKELQINATEPTIRLEESGAGSKRLELSVNASAEAKIFANQSGGILVLGTVGTERLRIDSSGNVGIGTASPAYKLDVSGDIGVGAGNKFTTVSGNDLNIDAPSTRSIFLRIAGSTKATIDSSGGVTIAGLAGAGSRAVNASAAGLLSAASDASLKEEVVGASIAGLNEILQIHPKMYRWKDDIANRGDEASVELGFIANDVAPIIPSAAPMGNDGFYGFYDRSITAALVKAVQELSAKVTALESA